MLLANDEVSIELASREIVLRPTLRAAVRLERKFGGFDSLLKLITDQNISAMAAIVEETSSGENDLLEFLAYAPERALAIKVGALVSPLVSLVLALAGVDTDDLDAAHKRSETPSKRVPFAEHHARLFRLATGWLGWTPETTWNATPAEIIEAYKGRVEMLKAIFGGNEDEQSSIEEQKRALHEDHFDRAGLRMLSGMNMAF
jgi:hypothetical protein